MWTPLGEKNLKEKEIQRNLMNSTSDRLDQLEARSVHVLREAYRDFKHLCMLWSIGKDSTVLLHLARKAFFSHAPFPLVHIDTGFKIPEMITYRDRLAREWGINLIVGQHKQALAEGRHYPGGKLDRIACCKTLKSEALKHTLAGTWPRWRLDRTTGELVQDSRTDAFTGVIVGVRADEEGSRSKERVFSPRDKTHDWNVDDQPPELWHQYKTDFAPGTHVRIHPLLDWTELNIWEYIERENIPIIDLYFDRGQGTRYRSLGCAPCTGKVQSTAKSIADIVAELRTGRYANIAERSGRAQDAADGGGLETLRREGYM
jgi:sulfate adenylyltransferase subunit 2